MADKETPILTQRIGVRHGAANMSWPFGRIDVYPGVFTVNGARFTFDNVVALVRHRGFFSDGIRIVHRSPNTAPKTCVFALSSGRLEAALRQAGFEIVDRFTDSAGAAES
jgi:hypothetical protein